MFSPATATRLRTSHPRYLQFLASFGVRPNLVGISALLPIRPSRVGALTLLLARSNRVVTSARSLIRRGVA